MNSFWLFYTSQFTELIKKKKKKEGCVINYSMTLKPAVRCYKKKLNNVLYAATGKWDHVRIKHLSWLSRHMSWDRPINNNRVTNNSWSRTLCCKNGAKTFKTTLDTCLKQLLNLFLQRIHTSLHRHEEKNKRRANYMQNYVLHYFLKLPLKMLKTLIIVPSCSLTVTAPSTEISFSEVSVQLEYLFYSAFATYIIMGGIRPFTMGWPV